MCKWTYNEGTLKLGNLVNTGAFTLKDLLVVYHRHEYCRFNLFLGYCCRDRCTTYPDDLSMLLSYTTNNKTRKKRGWQKASIVCILYIVVKQRNICHFGVDMKISSTINIRCVKHKVSSIEFSLGLIHQMSCYIVLAMASADV